MIFTFLLLLIAAGISGAAIGMGVYVAFFVCYYLLYAIGAYKMFEKAGVAGWKAFIPLLNEYEVYKLAWNPNMFWAYLACTVVDGLTRPKDGESGSVLTAVLGIAAFVVEVMLANKLAKAFGKGISFTIGLLLFQPIFIMILGLGDAKYLGPQA